MNIDYLSAFTVGLLGAGHCIAMCGGVSGMLLSALPNNVNQQAKWSFILAYNIGRIASYALIGAVVGFSSSIAAKSLGLPLNILKIVSGIFLILLGLYLGQWQMLLSRVEAIGKGLWQYISPLSKRCLPVNSTTKALAFGAIWGWLPCGLVYSTLTWALASGNTLDGALIMASFGLGTLPALLTLSLGVLSVKQLLQNITFKKLMALLLIFYGIYTVYIAYKSLI